MNCQKCKLKIDDLNNSLFRGIVICEKCDRPSNPCAHIRLKKYRDPSDSSLCLICKDCGAMPI